MNKYEDPTQRLVSHNWSDEYKENYEKIFGKKETWLERREREDKKNKLISYAHKEEPNEDRFVQFKKDPIPEWAVNILPYIEEEHDNSID